MGTFIHRESPVEYFKEMVEAALDRQQVEADEHTSYYLVNLLAGFASGRATAARASDAPLGLELIDALNSQPPRRGARLQDVGDRSLFISGFFSDSLKRSLADIDYYVALGVYAYHCLGREADDVLRPVFDELGQKFVRFVDVLAEVSERSALVSNNDVLRLYEKWLRTGSPRDGALLAERGIIPNRSIGERFLQ